MRETIHRQYRHEWAQLCSNKKLFTETGRGQVWSLGRGLLTSALDSECGCFRGAEFQGGWGCGHGTGFPALNFIKNWFSGKDLSITSGINMKRTNLRQALKRQWYKTSKPVEGKQSEKTIDWPKRRQEKRQKGREKHARTERNKRFNDHSELNPSGKRQAKIQLHTHLKLTKQRLKEKEWKK